MKNIQHKFNEVLKLSKIINNKFNYLSNYVYENDKIYLDFLNKYESNNNSNIYKFSIYSFYFRTRLIYTELNNLKNYNQELLNIIYYEYLNLYNMMNNFIINELNIKSKIKNFPPYKHLNNNNYNIELIKDLYNNILMNFNKFDMYIEDYNSEIHSHELQYNNYANINNFISLYIIDNVGVKIKMYKNYMYTFNNSYLVYFENLLEKCNNIINKLNENFIKCDVIEIVDNILDNIFI
jgi:hypothetical protein